VIVPALALLPADKPPRTITGKVVAITGKVVAIAGKVVAIADGDKLTVLDAAKFVLGLS